MGQIYILEHNIIGNIKIKCIKVLLPDSYTYPGRKVLLGFKVRSGLHTISGQHVVTEVSLQGVTCQLEVHLLLLTTFRAEHPLTQIQIVEMPCLSFTGTTGRDTKTCQKGGQRQV